MTATYDTRPLTFFRPDPHQPRRQFADADLRSLGESMLALGQLQPVGARPDGTLFWGERRFRAAQLVGMTELAVIVTDRHLSETEVRLIQLAENVHRADLRDAEKFRACEALLQLNPGWTHKELAAHLKLSESTVTKYLAPARCIPDVLAGLEAGTVGLSACYEISRVPADQQAELLALKLAGTSRDGLAERNRRRTKKATTQVRAKRLVCPLPSGVRVTLAGGSLSLDDGIAALADAAREMKRSRELGYTAKTFTAAMRDKARKEAPATPSD